MIAAEQPRPLRAWIIVGSTLFAATFGPLVIREAQLAGVPSLQLIFYRLLLTCTLLAPFMLRNERASVAALSGRDWLLLAVSGLFFAFNLICLFFALEYTSVLVTGVLRRTSPLWLAGMEVFFLGARFRRNLWYGLAIVIVGSAAVGFDANQLSAVGTNPQLGAALALIGALCIGIYLVIGRALRSRLPSLVYSWLVFGMAAIVILVVIVGSGAEQVGFSADTIFWIVAVTFVTQFLGQIPLNMGLHYFPATIMSLLMQSAIVFSAIIALFAYAEIPTPWQIIGSIAVLFGVYLINRKGAISRPPPA